MTTLQKGHNRPPTSSETTIEFRVSKPGLPRRRLKLSGARYTIGNGPDCSVRLDDASILPVHALLTRDGNRLLLSAFGEPIVVNEQSRSVVDLSVGDQFPIGSYLFELTAGPERAQSDIAQSDIAQSDIVKPPAASEAVPSAPSDEKVVPRRRLSFANAMQLAPEASAPETEEPSGQAESPAPPEKIAIDPRPAAAELFDQHKAILANERRWQERSQRQAEKFRQREIRNQAQLQSLQTAKDAAENRARGSEDAIDSLKRQITELTGRFAAITSTVVPCLEQRLEQQQQESVVASRQYQSLIDGLRGRLDFLQNALTSVQTETEEIRQQTVANREDQQEAIATAGALEKTIQMLSEDFQKGRSDADAKTTLLKENLQQTGIKLANLTGQLEETRQSGLGLAAMVQQLRGSLINSQTEAQRFATVEQIDDAVRMMRANDQRISQLTEEYDSQSQQLQHECDAIRQRLEDTENLASKAISAATDALHEALSHGGSVIANLSPENVSAEESSQESVDESIVFDDRFFQGSMDDVADEVAHEFIDEPSVGTADEIDDNHSPSPTISHFFTDIENDHERSVAYTSESLPDAIDAADEAYDRINQAYDRFDEEDEKATLDEDSISSFLTFRDQDQDQDQDQDYERTEFLNRDSIVPPSNEGQSNEAQNVVEAEGIEEESQISEELPVAKRSGPRSAAEILANMGLSYGDDDRDDNHGRASFDDSQIEDSQISEPTPYAGTHDDSSEEEEDDEDSIEEYMNRLLRRVQGQSDSGSIVETGKATESSQKSPVAALIAEDEDVGATVMMPLERESLPPATPAPILDSPYVPRSQAPERGGNIAAMRELANSSARTAIAQSGRRRIVNEVLFKYGLFAMGILAGIAVLAGTQFKLGPWMLIGFCCIALALFFLYEGITLSKDLAETARESGHEEGEEVE